MSFVKKGLKKVWGFVKKHWLKIVIVAAIVFTAGVASVGFAAFSGVSTAGGLFGAVGSTMWAGVAATAGSMGIGSGAIMPTTASTIAAGTAGTHVGLGAAWGAAGGAGWGAGAGSKIAAANAANAAAATAAPGTAAGVGGTSLAGNTTPSMASSLGGTTATPSTGMPGVAGGFSTATPAGVTPAANVAAATGKGLTLGGALETAGKLAPIAGAWMMAKGQEEQLNQYNTNAAFGGNQFDGPNASGAPGPGKNFLAPPGAEGGESAVAGAGTPDEAATGLMQGRMGSTTKPFQSIYGYKKNDGPSGAQSDIYGGPLMAQGAG